ncbi:lipoate--protein ligase family protein [Halobacterium litoreum]|uniref:Biotin/lipoate A/B protein ligase family protein n=1 Tax=Halobacterium litoreum TaxID=2039234 RepID=A0ABD5NGC0_9EURY|nr:biotin/lipoate A/B protein ligase family protein [Halobacterium litoreum]UHH12844.1 lipoate--protein ligase family protein [Halobacterium litoreum]
MALADREWRLIREEARDGPMQMALEEVAAETAADGGPRTVRAYTWSPSTLSMGYRQAAESVDWAFCEREGVDVTRRQTGGGGIYHDEFADISYSVVGPADELPGDLMECYDLLCEPILDAFHEMGVDAEFVPEEHPALHEPACYLRALHPAHDMTVDGRKIAGNAQYRTRDAVIQHGSLSYDLAPERHLGVFADPGVTPERFRERVTSIREESGVDRDEAVRAVEDALADWCDATVGEWTDDELAAARELADEKYATDAWTRDREA